MLLCKAHRRGSVLAGSRALVCKSEGLILPGVCRVTPGKSPQRSALLVHPVIKSPALQSRGCLCTALNNEVLILFEVPWHCIYTVILIILYDLLPHHQDRFKKNDPVIKGQSWGWEVQTSSPDFHYNFELSIYSFNWYKTLACIG